MQCEHNVALSTFVDWSNTFTLHDRVTLLITHIQPRDVTLTSISHFCNLGASHTIPEINGLAGKVDKTIQHILGKR